LPVLFCGPSCCLFIVPATLRSGNQSTNVQFAPKSAIAPNCPVTGNSYLKIEKAENHTHSRAANNHNPRKQTITAQFSMKVRNDL
jgi:hypothetical protein